MILTVLLILPCGYPQTQKSGESSAKTVTVTGCVYHGVECLLLKDSQGKQDYSITRTDKLTVGYAYRITGPVSDIGFCQEGKPILSPQKVTAVKLRCDSSGRSK
ncbi:MAG: hypothetical protein ACRD96_13375 [Bryobacteraceae bacterium]